ncbi:unannotated protein [freshwater metagenome]|uniref:Unannotated protein n=1 Tax=freshwater metagenome TaxID=449393 RepID=A0A6J5ZGX4_9ZZZZ
MVVTATLGTLSVVIIARDTSSSDSNFSAVAIDSRPEMIFGIGKSSPISPVEHTTTSPDEILRSSPTFSAVWCVSENPCGPVHAFAPPELSTAARTNFPFVTSRDQITGAATTLLVV